MNTNVRYFDNEILNDAAILVINNPFWDEESHHGELTERYFQAGKDRNLAALAATIQSGYWPNWMMVPLEAQDELREHIQQLEVGRNWYQREDFIF